MPRRLCDVRLGRTDIVGLLGARRVVEEGVLPDAVAARGDRLRPAVEVPVQPDDDEAVPVLSLRNPELPEIAFLTQDRLQGGGRHRLRQQALQACHGLSIGRKRVGALRHLGEARIGHHVGDSGQDLRACRLPHDLRHAIVGDRERRVAVGPVPGAAIVQQVIGQRSQRAPRLGTLTPVQTGGQVAQGTEVALQRTSTYAR